MWFGVITLFPDMFDAVLNYGVTGRAIKKNIIALNCWNPRNYTHDKHSTVDDKPYGGGPGMLMMAQPLRDAIIAAKSAAPKSAKVIYLSPQGKKVAQKDIKQVAQSNQSIIFVCGRYEGIDERLIGTYIDEEWSVGDFVVSGGELPAMTLIDATARLIPGVLGDIESAKYDSFANGLLDHPHYTRPDVFEGYAVPPVLLSGNHKVIHSWRMQQSLGRTWLRRPELLESLALTEEQQILLDEFISSYPMEQSINKTDTTE